MINNFHQDQKRSEYFYNIANSYQVGKNSHKYIILKTYHIKVF